MLTSRRNFLAGMLGAGLGFAGCRTRPPQPPSAPLPDPGNLVWNRIGYGPRSRDLSSGLSFEALLEQQLHPASIDDSECDQRLSPLKTMALPLHRLWSRYFDELDQSDLPLQECIAATFIRAVHSRRQLACRLAEFWHDHFNVYGPQDEVAPLFPHYDRLIRSHALGNFRAMLGAVARSPAMLFYLDNFRNQVAGPNENYARELLELHTVGVGQFSDNDVFEVARCFTGWGLDEETGRFKFRRSWHDRFNKLVLGHYLPADRGRSDGEAVLDLLAAHPATARRVCGKLCTRLLCDDPPATLVERAAALFRSRWQDADQLRQTVRLIVLSPEFRSTPAQKLKRPFDFTVSLLRANATALEKVEEDFVEGYDLLGQPLFGHFAPDGYPDRNEAWTGTMSMLGRFRLAEAIFAGEFDGMESGHPLLAALGPEFQLR